MKVSIVTVSYNSEKTIKDTIESVLWQDYPDIEYIIVDGGSTDSTINIIDEYQSKFVGRLSYISESDKGIYDAMNKGIMRTTGEIVGIINSDDFYSNSHVISRVVEEFSSNQIGALFGNLHFVCPDNLRKSVRAYSSKFCTPFWFRFGLIPAHPTFFVLGKYYKQFGLYDITFDISGDFDLMIRFLKVHRLKYKYLDYDMVTMRTGGASTKTLKTILFDNNRNVIRACRNNHIYTNIFMVSFRYIFKLVGALDRFKRR